MLKIGERLQVFAQQVELGFTSMPDRQLLKHAWANHEGIVRCAFVLTLILVATAPQAAPARARNRGTRARPSGAARSG